MNEAIDSLPIAGVEQETGQSKDVLRKRDVRYGYPVPCRDIMATGSIAGSRSPGFERSNA